MQRARRGRPRMVRLADGIGHSFPCLRALRKRSERWPRARRRVPRPARASGGAAASSRRCSTSEAIALRVSGTSASARPPDAAKVRTTARTIGREVVLGRARRVCAAGHRGEHARERLREARDRAIDAIAREHRIGLGRGGVATGDHDVEIALPVGGRAAERAGDDLRGFVGFALELRGAEREVLRARARRLDRGALLGRPARARARAASLTTRPARRRRPRSFSSSLRPTICSSRRCCTSSQSRFASASASPSLPCERETRRERERLATTSGGPSRRATRRPCSSPSRASSGFEAVGLVDEDLHGQLRASSPLRGCGARSA